MPEIRYSKDHEYIRVESGEGVVGISELRAAAVRRRCLC